MSKVTLPRTNQTGANEWADVEANDVALAEKINGGLDNENIASGANIARSKLEGGAQGIAGQWYTPSIIATEQTRESVTLGTLSTPDEITGITVPTNGVLRVGFLAVWKSSVSGAGRVALTVNNVGVGTPDENLIAEQATTGTTLHLLSTAVGDLRVLSTGVEISGVYAAGMSFVDIPILTGGTYAVAVKFRATSGSVTAKERRLYAMVFGF